MIDEKEMEKFWESPDDYKLRKEAAHELFNSGIVIFKQNENGKQEILKSGTPEWFDALEKARESNPPPPQQLQ